VLEVAIPLIGGCALFVTVTLLVLVAMRRIARERTDEVAYADLVALSEYVSSQQVAHGSTGERTRRRHGPPTEDDHPQLAAVLRALESESNG
jgi:hypothetical protein